MVAYELLHIEISLSSLEKLDLLTFELTFLLFFDLLDLFLEPRLLVTYFLCKWLESSLFDISIAKDDLSIRCFCFECKFDTVICFPVQFYTHIWSKIT